MNKKCVGSLQKKEQKMLIFRKKYRSTCTFAMFITKKSRRLHKILQDFFVIYIAKVINSSDKMNIYFWYNDMRGTSPTPCVKLLTVPQEHVHNTVK